MPKHYAQYCPVAHALERVGERWSLLIVRELLKGPKRYTDLAAALPRIGTNVLAARLKELESAGVVAKLRLPPPTPAQVYELTAYGFALKPVVRELARWGLQSMPAPGADDELAPGWLPDALDTFFAPVAPKGSFEFRIGDEVAALVDGEAAAGPAEHPDVVLEATPTAFYFLFTERRWDGVEVEGDRELLERLLDAAAPVDATVAA
ncbi:MAG TPA: helix-turn-helix domain-containing protein [Gaiellaceae bacterium]|nr:helix-turn-helix domain-containing protein [Gaiellaceae bacterium]